ncbi:MAG: S41 family peptidase [Lachnospiraceae bacterium]|nr:S41 family peptidase [Lachnospiraceae bacterium]
MQNQYSSGNNRVENQINYSVQKEKKQKPGTRYYLLGMITGILVTIAVTLGTAGMVRFYQAVLPDSRGNAALGTQSGETGSITDASVEKKLAVLEDTIGKYFWKDVEEETLQDGLYKGLLNALDDPYSVYYTNEELIALQEQTEGIYYGIGAYIQDGEAGYAQISRVIKNTPAEESGLMQGDYIYKVNDEDMQGKDKSYVVSKIKGEEHTYVTLTVIRESAAEPLDINVERRKIESPTVEYEMYENGMAYIQITEFDLVTTGQFESAYNQAKAEGMKGLIIDLRSNPGGNLSTVCDIARMLLPKGMIVYTEDKYGKREEYTCRGDNKIEVPLVVLTNGYSASASEILAGAVKDYGIGKLVGTTTFGKGIVQKVINLSDGSAIKLTVSSYFTPNGNNIHGIGIDPDVEVPFDAELYQNGTDNQLEKAKEVLAEMMQ